MQSPLFDAGKCPLLESPGVRTHEKGTSIMQAITKLTLPITALTLASAASAQGVQLNEIYVSHSGTDDQEYVELIGAPGASLDNLMILIVEGDAGSSVALLDRAWDLSGNVIPADGYFVVGGDAVPDLDLSVGATNLIENGSDTFYLLEAADVAAVSALLGTDVRTDPLLTTTVIPTLGTVLDSVALIDGDAGDLVFDGAVTYGPDGSFLPAGIFRGYDAPNNWCPNIFLDFDDVANLAEVRTPGGQNVNCDSAINEYCVAQVNSQGCTPLLSVSGAPSATLGSNFQIGASQLRSNSFALLIYSTTGGAATPFNGGTLCLAAGSVLRTPAQFTGGALGTPCDGLADFDFNSYIAGGSDAALVEGQDVYVQYWSRDDQAAPASNLTSALVFNIGA